MRLRLLKAEVARFAETGVVREIIGFGSGPQLRYTLEAHDGPVLTTSFDGQEIRVSVPRAQATQWSRSEQVSIVGEETTAAGTLKILIEKDFACLNPSAVWQEDQSDAYPNPHPSCGSNSGS